MELMGNYYYGFQIICQTESQGSVLGPLLFLIYVNDIAESVLSLTRLFADDSSLYFAGSPLDERRNYES